MATVSKATAQGSRAEQQDRWVSQAFTDSPVPGHLLAVADGHGGVEAADRVISSLESLFLNSLQKTPTDIPQAFRSTIAELHQLTQTCNAGTSLSLAFIPKGEREVHWAALGDSPILILNAENEFHVSPLHNVRCSLQERAAALTRGGQYVGGYLHDPQNPEFGLQLSRSLGDQHLSRVLSRDPDVGRQSLGPTSFILVGTDGLLDSFDDSLEPQLQRLLQLIEDGSTAESLISDALKRQTGDNVTALLWKGSGGVH